MTFEHNVLAYGDNLDYLQGLPSESVDLVYLDPPYNSKRDYNATFGADSQVKAFEDTWSWGADDDKALRDFAKANKQLGRFLISLGELLPKRGLYPYLVNMAQRLQELHRLLKPTGSIYLHVDPTASHYLKLVMDQIFNGGNFRNEILWCYSGPARATRYYAKKHDAILFYTKTDDYTFNVQRTPYDPATVARRRHAETTRGGIKFQGMSEEALEAGKALSNWWTDIPSGGQISRKELLGYPTQKPLALLERIILASSNEGDVVLDPYMGSGTTIEAAAKHGRKWIGIDLTPIAVATAKARLDQAGVDLSSLDEWGSPQDIDSARHLYEQDKRAFDCWAVMRCSAMPADTQERVIGLRSYMRFDSKGLHHCKALYAVSLDEPPTINDVNRLKALMKQRGAEMGFLICFDLPSADVLEAVAAAGQVKLNGDAKKAPKTQIITVQDVIDQSYLATEVFSHERVERQTPVQQMELV